MPECKCNCSNDNHSMENKKLLQSANLKNTEKRNHLLNCLRHATSPMSAEDIYLTIRDSTDINLSTVYRILNKFTDVGIVLKQTLSDGNSVFQLKNEEHKHLLTCKMCGCKNYINICPIIDLEDRISDETGYIITSHNLEFIGICPDCLHNIENKKNKML